MITVRKVRFFNCFILAQSLIIDTVIMKYHVYGKLFNKSMFSVEGHIHYATNQHGHF